MGAKSRRKGKGGELELSRVLTAAGFPATRGQQHRGGPGSPDVLCEALPGIHWESKRTERLDLYGALAQASRESGRQQIAVVAHRRNDCEWVAILRLDDLLDILRGSDLVRPTVADAAAAVGGVVEGVESAEVSRHV